MKSMNLKNQVFGRLLALEQVGVNKQGNAIWLCRCSCGNEIKTLASYLRNKHTQSCGCYMKEQLAKSKTTHNKRYSSEYSTWCDIKRRCTKENRKDYPRYGGRGIKVCEEWLNSFEAFYKDMGDKPLGFSIERLDVNGNYEPSNCVWIPLVEQVKNKRNTKRITNE